MGRVRTKTVKKASRVIIEKYYGRLTQDFDINKRVIDEIAIISSKRLRNKISGFTTEEERERRMDFIPEESAIQVDAIEVDKDTMDMLKDIGCGSLPGLSVVQTRAQTFQKPGGFRGERPERK